MTIQLTSPVKFKAQGGDSILQRLKRIVFDAKATVVVSCHSLFNVIEN